MYHTQQSHQKSYITGNEEKVYKRKIKCPKAGIQAHFSMDSDCFVYNFEMYCIQEELLSLDKKLTTTKINVDRVRKNIYLQKSALKATTKYNPLKMEYICSPFRK